MATNIKFSSDPTSNCFEHPNEEIRFYCENCYVYICDDCIAGLGKHSKCNKTKLAEHGNKQRQSLIDYTTCADTHISRLDKVLEQTAKTKLAFNESIDDNIKSIQSKRELLRSNFDKLKDDLIEQFNDARKIANESFDEFADQLKRRSTRLKEISHEIQSKGRSIDGKELAFYDSQLKEILESSHTSETMPKIEQPKYFFDDHYEKMDNLQYIMGHLDYGDYDKLQLNQSIQKLKANTDSSVLYGETSSDFYGKYAANKTERQYITLKSFNQNKSVLRIVPTKQSKNAWILGKEIGQLDFSTEQPTYTHLLSLTDKRPITATKSKEHGLLLSFSHSKSIKKLYFFGTSRGKPTFKLKSHIKIHSQYISATCTAFQADKDIAVCLKEYPLSGRSEEKQIVIQWFSSGKMKVNEMCVSLSKTEIENPIHMSENNNGDICLTCLPSEKSSWILLLDKYGSTKMRYPSITTDLTVRHYFIGAEFLKDGLITILDRRNCCQHLINAEGEVLQINSYSNLPSCFAVDECDFIWVGFDDGTIQLMAYEDLTYEVLQNKANI